jgi:hypothetical protein
VNALPLPALHMQVGLGLFVILRGGSRQERAEGYEQYAASAAKLSHRSMTTTSALRRLLCQRESFATCADVNCVCVLLQLVGPRLSLALEATSALRCLLLPVLHMLKLPMHLHSSLL